MKGSRLAGLMMLLAAAAPAQPPLLVPDHLAVLPREETAGMAASVDPRGFNDDGFTGAYFPYQVGPWLVLFDERGPGELVRVHKAYWATVLGTPFEQYPVFIFLDDQPNPVAVLDIQSIFAGAPPFSPQLSGAGIGGDWAYLSLPFQQRLRIAAPYTTGPFGVPMPTTFYQFNFRRGQARNEAADWARLASTAGTWPHFAAQNWQPAVSANALAPNQSAQLAVLQGPGTIFGLDVHVQSPDDWNRLWLSIRWDTETAPSINVPLGVLFGGSRPVYANNSVMSWMDGSTHGRCFWPMPFRTAARISVQNRGTSPAGLQCSWSLSSQPYPEPFGFFCATESESLPTQLDRDHVVLATSGWGRYVGTVLEAESLASWLSTHSLSTLLSYLEGDERIYLDGSKTPLHGTGTEVYFNWSWYDDNSVDVPFTRPFHGYSGRTYVSFPGDAALLRSLHRWHLPDAIPFYREILFRLEHGGQNDALVNYRSAALYYAQPSILDIVDTVDVGNAVSETAHDYQSAGSAPYWLVSRIFGDASDPLGVDDGRRIPLGSTVKFTVQVPAAQTGVRLRCRIDQEAGPCDALVKVNGTFAGHWYRSVSNPFWSAAPFAPHRRWMDIEFEIPRNLTAGQTSLDIEIAPLGPGSWREFRYDVLSYR